MKARTAAIGLGLASSLALLPSGCASPNPNAPCSFYDVNGHEISPIVHNGERAIVVEEYAPILGGFVASSFIRGTDQTGYSIELPNLPDEIDTQIEGTDAVGQVVVANSVFGFSNGCVNRDHISASGAPNVAISVSRPSGNS